MMYLPAYRFLHLCSIVIGLCLFISSPAAENDRITLKYAACSKEHAHLYKDADINAPIIKKVPWMTSFVVIREHKDTKNRQWVYVGKYIDVYTARPEGWLLKDNLVMARNKDRDVQAIEESGIYKKAIVVVHYDRTANVTKGAPVRKAPLSSAPKVGQDLTLFNIYHVYDKRYDPQNNETFFLLGNEPTVIDPFNPGNTIIGWVPDSKLFLWNTREAAEYDKSTLPNRGLVHIYEKESEQADILRGKTPPDKIEPLATESAQKQEIFPEDPRFPIIDKEKEVNGTKIWHIGFVADEIGGAGLAKREKAAGLTRLPNVVDILFIYDGTGSMSAYKDAVIMAVKRVQDSAEAYWKKHYIGEIQADLRFSIAMYKDYKEPDHYKRLPLEKDNADKLRSFIDSHEFKGGEDKPAVFNGISTALQDIIPELRKESFRAVFLIGDMGNMGVSDQPDPQGHTVASVVKLLKSCQCDFYAIHVADPQGHLAFDKFQTQVTQIKNELPEGLSDYILITDPHKIEQQIYDKTLTILDQRYAVTRIITHVSTTGVLGPQVSGTVLGQRAIQIMKRYGLDPEDFSTQGVAPFAKGWITPVEPATGKQMMKPVVLMSKYEVESLIALLGMLRQVKEDNVKKGWIRSIEESTGDKINNKMTPAESIKKHLGIPVKSGILNMTYEQIGRLPPQKVKKAIKQFERKLVMLRAVVSGKDIKLEQDDRGHFISKPLGVKRYWFGIRGNERTWLDMNEYLP